MIKNRLEAFSDGVITACRSRHQEASGLISLAVSDSQTAGRRGFQVLNCKTS
jgi:hypothetical protein